MRRAVFWIPALTVALLACSDGHSAREQATIDEAMASLEEAPKRIRTEVLRTCEKWMHKLRRCEDPAVRLDQMECWLETGLPHLKRALKRNMGQRARDRKTLQHQSLCMDRRGWRHREPTKDFF